MIKCELKMHITWHASEIDNNNNNIHRQKSSGNKKN